MYKLNHTTLLSAHAVCRLSKNKRINAEELADRLDASTNTLVKALKKLAKAGVLKSKRGPNGGFALTKSLTKVSLLDVYRAIEGEPPGCCQIHQRSMKSCPLCRHVKTTTKNLGNASLDMLKGKLK